MTKNTDTAPKPDAVKTWNVKAANMAGEIVKESTPQATNPSDAADTMAADLGLSNFAFVMATPAGAQFRGMSEADGVPYTVTVSEPA